MLKTILSVIFVLICLALTVIVLLQEGKSQGLGAIGGMADTYWGKNKGRSMEGYPGKVHDICGSSIHGTGNRIKLSLKAG